VQHLSDACGRLQFLATSGVLLPPIACIVANYRDWQVGVSGLAASGSNNLTTDRLYNYSANSGAIRDVGFSSLGPDGIQLTFVRVSARIATMTTASNAAVYVSYSKMLDIANGLQEGMRAAGLPVVVKQTSLSWANAVAAHVSLSTLKFTTGVGVAVMFAIVTSVFGNMRIALFAALGVVLVLCGTLAAAAVQGWDIDAVTQICVAGVIAIAAEHLVHIIDGYQDFLQSTQSHMFALATTKMHAFRGALTRTGGSIVTSTVAVIAVSIMFIPSSIQPFRRAAQVMITVHILTLFSAIFFGASLCAAGPLRLFRHWAASTVLCCLCCVCGGIIVLIIYLAHGVEGPSGYSVP
jgi:hypothetical protein